MHVARMHGFVIILIFVLLGTRSNTGIVYIYKISIEKSLKHTKWKELLHCIIHGAF